MTVELPAHEQPTVESPASHVRGPKDSPPIVWLARLGGLIVVLQVYVYLRWIFSDDFHSVSPSGADAVPGSTHDWIMFWQIVSVLGGLVFLGWIARRTWRDRALPPLGIYVAAWFLTAWQDPGVNMMRPVFAYNSDWFNRGTWADFLPGWVSKGAETPQPIIYWLANYVLFMPLAVMGLDSMIRWFKRVMPRLNRAGVATILFVMFTVLDIVLEQFFLRTRLWTYPRVNAHWSIFGGTLNQFPLYEAIAFGGIVNVIGILIYAYRNSNDQMISDTGIDRRRTKRGTSIVRVLSLAAVFNILMLVFNMGFNVVNQHANKTPTKVPSYISNNLCGIGDNPPCPPRP